MTEPELGVGCPMWAHRGWVGTHLPSDTPAGGELGAYARICNAVEGNTTFYAVPGPAVVDRWRDQTGPGFRFAFKLPRAITHDRRLRDCAAETREFVTRIEPLAGRLGPVCIQLPASFAPDSLPVLEQFLTDLPDVMQWSVEVRHPGFHAGGDSERELNDLLHSVGVNRVMLDTRALFAGPRVTAEEIETWERKPRLAVRAVATGPEPVVRFVGQTDAAANPSFWEPWVDRVIRWLGVGLSPIVFIHTPDNVVSPSLARRFHSDVAKRHPALEALPEPLPVAGTQALFEI